MGNEASKAALRRSRHPRYANRYFVGLGLDVGPGTDGIKHHRDKFPNMLGVDEFDMPGTTANIQGDAQYLAPIPANTYDWLHSSHCLEHLNDPFVGLEHWLRVVKPGGYLVITVPDEDLYEQGVWPSTFSGHQRSFTICKARSWSPASVNVVDLFSRLADRAKPISCGLHDYGHVYDTERFDQTGGEAEVDLEFILRKL